jgi:hypothetical protein
MMSASSLCVAVATEGDEMGIVVTYTGRNIERTLEAAWAWSEACRRMYKTQPRSGARKEAVGLFQYAWGRLLYLSGRFDYASSHWRA